jgi:hypothetical protein
MGMSMRILKAGNKTKGTRINECLFKDCRQGGVSCISGSSFEECREPFPTSTIHC